MTGTSGLESSQDIEVDELEKLLQLAEEQENQNPEVFVPRLREDDTFANSFKSVENITVKDPKTSASTFHEDTGDLDSSDDEEVRNFLERKYNEYGRDINKKLKQQNEEVKEAKITNEIERSFKSSSGRCLTNSFNKRNSVNDSESTSTAALFNKNKTREAYTTPPTGGVSQVPSLVRNTENTMSTGVYTDPIFGMRLINPLISSSVLEERMSGRKAVAFSSVEFHIQCGDLTKDWVIAGAVLSKSPVKTTKTGASYSIWKLSDLKGDIKTATLFLFKSAHKELWKTATGMVIAILNPGIFEKRTEKKDVACFTIDNPQKVMILGQSKDMGTCKAKKKNGEPCGAIVNLGSCDFCIYHVRQEYGKMSKRSELQSATSGRGLNELRNKVLGKNEVFYGGQSYTAIPAKKSLKQIAKDQKRLMTLSDYNQSPNAGSINHISGPKVIKEIPYAARGGPTSKIASNVEANTKQRLKDLERLKMLKEENSPEVTNQSEPDTSKSSQLSSQISSLVPDKFKGKEFSFNTNAPTLSQDGFSIEVNISSKKAQLAKLKALELIKKKPIQKLNPNNSRGTLEGKRRAIDELENSFEGEPKKLKLDKEQEERKSRIQKIMDATSSHLNLIKSRQNEEQEKYFNKLEKKEAMEEKMLNTFKVACKAVICLKCKYTSFSAADRCKEEKHPLKVIDAEKRFFQCQDCGNRTATVHKIPKLSCKTCNSSRWQRAAMIREKKVGNGPGLSIRGDEEKFIGSTNTSANLNLLVPED